MPSQIGEATLTVAGETVRVRLQEPVVLSFANGGTAKGILDAAPPGFVQIRVGTATTSYPLADVTRVAQF